MARKAFIIIGVLVVIGVAIGIIVAVTSGGTNATTKSDTTLDKTSSISANNNVSNADLLGPDATEVSGNGTTGAKVAVKNEPTSDPETAKAAMHLLAIGDWGATQFKPGSCCNKYVKTAPGSLEFKRDYWAQINVAEILSQSAAQNKPERVIGHGDNLYWNGAGAKDIDIRMQKTFEDIYNQPSLQGIKWINVVGNHDVGGSAYICGDYDENFKQCGSTAEMLAALDNKFEMQQKYKSQDDDRWQLRDHYYVESVEKNGVSVDIFNIDTNIAESHGARQICCQCYGYVGSASKDEAEAKVLGRQCNDAQAGDKFCAGGDVGMYNACYDKIKGWHDDSMTKIQADLKKSKATWKIINSHYSPHFHMDEPKMKQWYAITKEYNVQVWMNGHTHGFNHDIGVWGTHFFENGGGGGIQSETSGHPPEIAEKFVKHAWIEGTRAYGFFELHLSKDWMKMEFVTFDSAWVFDDKIEGIKKGGMMKNHCWHVPVTGGEGRACAK